MQASSISILVCLLASLPLSVDQNVAAPPIPASVKSACASEQMAKGNGFMFFGKMKQAEEAYRKALEWYCEIDPESEDVARASYNLAGALIFCDRHREAEGLLLKSRRIYQNLNQPDSRQAVARAESLLGQVYHGVGKYRLAKEAFERTADYYSKRAPQDSTFAMGWLATVILKGGRPKEAEKVIAKALQPDGEKLVSDLERLLQLRHGIPIYLELGQIEKAEALLAEASAIGKKRGEKDTLLAYESGLVALSKKQFAKAKQFFEAWFAWVKDHQALKSNALEGIGLALWELNDLEGSQLAFLQCLEIRMEMFGECQPESIRALYHCGQILIAFGNLVEGTAAVDRALALYETWAVDNALIE